MKNLQAISPKRILRSQLLILAFISLGLIVIQAAPIQAQWTTNGNNINNTNSGNVGIGDASPTAKLVVGTASPGIKAIGGLINNGISISSNGPSTVIGGENTAGSGAFSAFYSNRGFPMISGDRLGGLMIGGSSSASTLRNSGMVGAFATQDWVDGSAYGTALAFETTANGSTARTEKL